MQDDDSFLDQIRFSQRLSLWQAAARGLGVIAVAAIFVLLGQAVTTAGPLAPLALLLAALLAAVNSLGYAELAAGGPRAGGAYTLIHDGPVGLTFITGWALGLSGLGLCAVLAQGAGRYLAALLADLVGLAVPSGFLAMGFVALTVLGISLGAWRRRRLRFTVPLLILLVILAAVAFSRVQAVNYETIGQQPGPAVAELLVAFVGLEIITSQQREIRRRVVNLTRALLLALALSALLGAAVAAGAVGATGAEAIAGADAPLAPVGTVIAGSAGRTVVLVVGTIALVVSLGRALPWVVRHLYVMSRDGFWPAWVRQTHPRRRVPVRLILLVGLLVLPVVWVPPALLSRIGGLLYLFVLMIVNLTLARRPRQEARPGFSLPFHPWVPALTLAVDLLVIPLWGLLPAAWVAGCLAAGGLVYLSYGRRRHIEAQEGVIVFRPPAEERPPTAFRVLVPIANPATAGTLLRMASHLAKAEGGDVLALQVVVVPEPVPLEGGRRRAQANRALLEQALALANEESLPVEAMTRVARSVAQGILDTANEERVDLILLGWRGPARFRGASLGPIVDAVLQNAPCDVLVTRGEDSVAPKRILVPTAGGPHARTATRLALSLAQAVGAQVTLLCVQLGPATSEQLEERRCRIAEMVEELAPERLPEQKVVVAASVTQGIVEEAQAYDLVLLGVSDESLLDRIVFGSVPLQVAARVPAAALVQGYRGLTGIWTRQLLRALRGAVPALSGEEQLEVHQALSRGAQPGINYFVLIVLSCVIAALGLLLDSPAVVIGAMLVAPLMSPILAFSLSLVLGDLRLIRFSAEAILKGVALALVIAAFIGLLSPLKTVTAEMIARGRPTLLDMAVALASGMAGAYAVARKDVSAALPGVAIAAALMPPLAAVGLSLSLGDARVAGGAFLLFITNTAAISLAGGVVFLILGIRPRMWGPESRRRLRQRLIASLLLLLAIAVPLGVVMAGVVRDATQERAVREALLQQLAAEDGQLVALEIERGRAELVVVATVRSTGTFDRETVTGLAEALSRQLGRPVQLEMVALPVVRSAGD